MRLEDRGKFAELMLVLAETFGTTAPSKEKIEIYYRVLGDLSIEDIDRSVLRLLNTRTVRGTFPVPAEIRDAAGGGTSAALLALDKAEKAVERHGIYKAVIFDDPVIHMVVNAMGGWPKFCRPDAFGEEEAPHWVRKQFIALYETFARNPRAECPKVLIGLGETSYQRGDEVVVVPPVIVGDREKALLWTGKAQAKLDAPSVADDLAAAISGKMRMPGGKP